MAMQIDLTPTERLLMLSLQFEPKQTLERLQKTTRTNTSKHLAGAVRTLRLARIVVPELGEDGLERYSLCVGASAARFGRQDGRTDEALGPSNSPLGNRVVPADTDLRILHIAGSSGFDGRPFDSFFEGSTRARWPGDLREATLRCFS